jgi:hypothetical protein
MKRIAAKLFKHPVGASIPMPLIRLQRSGANKNNAWYERDQKKQHPNKTHDPPSDRANGASFRYLIHQTLIAFIKMLDRR